MSLTSRRTQLQVSRVKMSCFVNLTTVIVISAEKHMIIKIKCVAIYVFIPLLMTSQLQTILIANELIIYRLMMYW